MLETINLDSQLSKDAYRDGIKCLRDRLSALQHDVKDGGLPVIIIFEGWSAAGKGSKMSEIIKSLDPRYFTTHCTKPPSADEARKPFLWRHWLGIPAKGNIAIYDRSWYPEASADFVENRISEEEAEHRLDAINKFERQLSDDGALIVKFFLHISRDEQKKRLDNLATNTDTAWRVVPADYKRNHNYTKFYAAYDHMIKVTNTAYAPWRLIAGHDARHAATEIYKTLIGAIEDALAASASQSARGAADGVECADGAVPGESRVSQADANAQDGAGYGAAHSALSAGGAPLIAMQRLRDVKLDMTIDDDDYKDRLAAAQTRLFSLHNAIYRKKIPLVIAYEGWDAAGKGGNIKRLTAALDPRGYEVIPIAAPSARELSYPFTWRFWQALPKDGHIAIFDRTWYGRVLVERLEGFAKEGEWRRAYREINEFEADLVHWGAAVVKFWLHIDKDEQLRRFQSRQQTPEKQWKINDEDWRNREKWDEYEEATDDMLRLTSTAYAPWYVIESQNKRYARVKTIETLIAALEKRLG